MKTSFHHKIKRQDNFEYKSLTYSQIETFILMSLYDLKISTFLILKYNVKKWIF